MSRGQLTRELTVFDENRDRLLAEAEGRWIVIADGKIQGVWCTYEDALQYGYDTFGLEPFLVKKVEAVDAASRL